MTVYTRHVSYIKNARMGLFQEEAYSYLQMGIDGSEYGTSGSGIVDYEYMINEGIEAVNHRQSLAQECSEDEDAEEEHVEGSHYENDEAFARALQDAEQRDATTYMMGLIGVEGCMCFCHVHRLILGVY